MKYVLITGGSQGLGKSLVNVFASNQYNVIIGYLSNKDKALKLCDEVSSKDGIDTYSPISLDYSSSKAGIINLSCNLSLYYKDKKIICICPGWINTESVMNMNPLYLSNEMKRIGQNELLDKDYVAKKIFDIATGDVESGSVIEI